MKKTMTTVALVASAAAAPALASIRITEYMYQGASGANSEFFEITNVGAAAIDLTGWSFDDDSRLAGTVSLSSLGTLAAGESAIVTELSAVAFRSRWGLAASVKVLGGSTTNFGRVDEINIFDATNTLVDRLTYDDQTGKGPRTNGRSANIAFANLGTNNAALAVQSASGDLYGSYLSPTGGDLGNPGVYVIPGPATLALATFGGVLATRRRRA